MPGSTPAEQIKALLHSASQGDRRAADSLLPLLYDELRTLAERRMQDERPGQTLQPTALVHEAYLRIAGRDDPGWDHAGHFFAAAAEAMRRILIEKARRTRRPKHGGGMQRVDLETVSVEPDEPHVDVLDLHTAIGEIEAEHERKGRIAVLRCFGGLTPDEIASAMGVSLSTVEREWRFTKALLQQKLDGGLPD